MKAHIVGVGMTKVGRLYNRSLMDLASEAILKALSDAGATIEDIEALFVSSAFPEFLTYQADLATQLAQELGLRIQAMRIEAGECSGAAAIKEAVDSVNSHSLKAALVVGVEKMSEFPSQKANAALASILNHEVEGIRNFAPVNYAALTMKEYMKKYGVSREKLYSWALKMHGKAVNNPLAHLNFPLRPESLKNAQVISSPITLYDMHPLSDGAAAALITNEELAPSFHSKCVSVESIESASSIPFYMREDLTSLPSLQEAYTRLRRKTGFQASPEASIQIHDSFSIYGILAIEELGLAERGKGAEALEGLNYINVGGGLKARGHPIGATPLYQIAESVNMLRGGFAGVKYGGNYALIHSMSGPDNASWLILLRRC